MERVAFVTGASRGIGRAIAKTLSQHQYAVALFSRDKTKLESLAQELTSPCLILPGDVTRYNDVVQAFHKVKETWGRLDVLINNAGIGVFESIETMSVDDFDAVIRTNVYGPFFCAKQAVPLMRQNGGGYIINIGSLAGVNTFKGGGAYCASKFALRALSEVLMLEVRYDNIKVTTLAPGSVNTEFSGQEPTGTWKIQPEDIAETVIHLLNMPDRTLSSYIEMRPTKPPRRS